MGALGDRRIQIALINLNDGSRSSRFQLYSTISTNNPLPRYVTTDGHAVYCGFREASAERLDTVLPAGNTFTRIKQETPSGAGDMCFDGQFFWLVDSSNVYQLSGPFVSSTVLKQWAHGLSSVRGLMTDGQNIIIMTA